MKAGVVTFPGSNCDDDCRFVLARHSGFEVQSLWHKDSPELGDFDLIALPGGFSYGDYLRCGAMAALSPIMQKVKEYADRGGKVIGICNGFQILCEAGMLPGALARNAGLRFVCKDVHVRVQSSESPWTCEITNGSVLSLPIAHGDGRYVISDEDFAKVQASGQVLMKYCTSGGEETEASNPNGSAHQIAGICNAQKNVFGLMPHPERATDLRSLDGMKLWSSIVRTLREKKA